MYIYDLPTTGTISFSDFLVTTELVSQVSQTTQLRARLRAVLKENRAGTSTLPSSSSSFAGSGSEVGGWDVGNTDWLTIVKTIEEYLPHLLGVFNCIQTDDLILGYEPVFSWRTAVSSSRFRGPQRIELAGLYYELASTLLTYALTLSNFASATVEGLGSFERDRNVSAEQRKVKDNKLRSAADTLCRSSGILLFLSTELLPKWRNTVGRVDGLPPDLTEEATLGLSKVCLAEAQALAIRKLVSPSVGLAVDTVTPGPPLERGHPSASLLAKLHLSVVEEMESAVGLMRTVGEKGKGKGKGRGRGGGGGGGNMKVGEIGLSANYEHELSRRISETNDAMANMRVDAEDEREGGGGGGGGKGKKLFGKFKLNKNGGQGSGPRDASRTGGSGGGGGGGGGGAFYAAPSPSSTSTSDLEISSSLLKYLNFSAQFHRAMAYKWLGIDAGESSNKVGSGIAFLSLSSTILSSSSLRDLTSSLSNISISSSTLLPGKRKGKTADRGVVDQEQATVEHWLASYKKLNDTVSFQPIPAASEVQARVPAGRAALLVKKYSLPSPAWGPGSEGYKGRGGGGLSREELHLLGEEHPARRNLVGMETGGSGGGDGKGGEGGKDAGYAGQGAYY